MARGEHPPIGLQKRISPHGRITAVSMMKDEGPYLLEWIAHHLAVGFTDIIVYTNDCSDGTDAMLIRLEELGLAHHRRNIIPEGLRPQPSALNHAQQEALVGASDWVMVFDADEFLCIRHGDGTLDGMISDIKARGANGIVLTWRIFGSGGVQDWSRDPVTEQYLMAAPPDWNKGWGVKTLFQFDPEHWKLGIHRPKIKNKWLETDFPDSIRWLNGSGAPMEDYFKFRGWRSITRTIGYDWAQVNHYAVKSIDSYAIRKFRGNVNFKKDKYNSDYWALQDRNEVRDDTILRHAPARQAIFAALLRDPELNRLHFAALARAEARLAEFRQTPEYGALVAGLRAASAVPIAAVEAKPPQPRDPARIAALMSRVEKSASARQKAARQTAAASGLAAPQPLYVVGGALGDGAGWHSNHGVNLPADPGLFTLQALGLITTGKFERAMARHLPRLTGRSQRHAEIGAGCGFHAAIIARAHPDLAQYLWESDAALAQAAAKIWARNGLDLAMHRAGGLADFLADADADSLLISDPMLTPDTLRATLPRPPHQIIVTRHALQGRADLRGDYDALCAEWGLDSIAAPEPGMLIARRP